MVDYRTADRFAAAMARARPKFAGAFHADAYQLLRTTKVRDSVGNETTTETVIEIGRCQLIQVQSQGGERYSGDVLRSEYRTSAELPMNTLAEPEDVLEVNGDRYQLVVVRQPGKLGTFPVAELEAIS